jgi:cysteine synthase A
MVTVRIEHIPWIHNVKNTDAVCAIDDEDPLRIMRLFNEPGGQEWLKKNGISDEVISKLPWLGVSSISNMLSSIKLAKYYEMNEDDVIFTIFTDSKEMYNSRLDEMNQTWGKYSVLQSEVDWTAVVKKQSIDYFQELSYYDKKRIHNLKYFTWVEQQGKTVEELNSQWYDENYWKERLSIAPEWDELIDNFNKQVGLES